MRVFVATKVERIGCRPHQHPARLQHACRLGERGLGIVQMLEHVERAHHVERGIGKRQAIGEPMEHPPAGGRRFVSRARERVAAHVDTEGVESTRGCFGDEVAVGAPEIEPPRAARQTHREVRHPVAPSGVLALVSGRGVTAVGAVIVALVVQGPERARVQIGRGRHDRRAHSTGRNQGAILPAHAGSGRS